MSKLRNASAVPQAILRECVIAPGKTAAVTHGALENPGVKARIERGDLVPVGTRKARTTGASANDEEMSNGDG